MKTIFTNAFLTIILLLAPKQDGFSQSFADLNFESAHIVPDTNSPFYPYAIAVSNALPSWTVISGAIAPYDVLYNDVSLGAAAVSIHDTNGFEPVLQGHYSVLLQGANPGTSRAAIAQTAQIPFSALSLQFFGVLGSFQTTFNGQVIPLSALGNGPNYTVYGGDISGFAGQIGELRFTALSPGQALIDNIQFSAQPIPEPSGLALFSVSALFLGFFRRRNSSR